MARQELGLTRFELAKLTELSYSTIHAAEIGRTIKIPAAILQFLTTRGWQTSDLVEAQRKFQEELQTEAQQKILEDAVGGLE
jgi:DNA-binding XRE family transcriptional regulator